MSADGSLTNSVGDSAMEFLPEELIVKILLLLDPRSLASASAISRRFWRLTVERDDLWRKVYLKEFADVDELFGRAATALTESKRWREAFFERMVFEKKLIQGALKLADFHAIDSHTVNTVSSHAAEACLDGVTCTAHQECCGHEKKDVKESLGVAACHRALARTEPSDIYGLYYIRSVLDHYVCAQRVARVAAFAALDVERQDASILVGLRALEDVLRHHIPRLFDAMQVFGAGTQAADISADLPDDFADRFVRDIATATKAIAGPNATTDEKFEALRTFLSTEGFTGNVEDYYNLLNSMVTHVLRTQKGNPITLSVIAISIGHHLGVNLQPVNFPYHFLVRYVTEAGDPIFLDVFNQCQRYTFEELSVKFAPQHVSQEHVEPVHASDVLVRVIRNVVSQMDDTPHKAVPLFLQLALELGQCACAIAPTDQRWRLTTASMFERVGDLPAALVAMTSLCEDSDLGGPTLRMLQSMRARTTLDMAQAFQRRTQDPVARSVLTSSMDIKPSFAPYCGALCWHVLHGYTCVVTGWDLACTMPKEWQTRMAVDHLKRGAAQPFFHVLVDDGSVRYAAADNLLLILGMVAQETMPFSKLRLAMAATIREHPHSIGRFFSGFNGATMSYNLNPGLAKHYPEDGAAAAAWRPQILHFKTA